METVTTGERKAGASVAFGRLESIDVLRGAVMVLMALDHVRGFFGLTDFDPTDVTQTTPALFFTRWVTHFVAPVFVLLAGTAAYLQLAKGKSRRDLSRFLLTRGLWLVALELTIVTVAWSFAPPWLGMGAGVIWALGWSMVALAALLHLPLRWLVAVGVVLVAGHNLLDGVTPDAFGPLAPAWMVLHEGGEVSPAPEDFSFYVLYPLMPWIGVMALGFALGSLYQRDGEARRRILLRLGLAITAAFVLLRLANVYGDPRPWSVQGDAISTLMSFLACEKYPPSLLFLLMTLGPSLVALGALERLRGEAARFLVVLGRAPLLYYVLHLYLIHALAILATLLAGYDASTWYGTGYYTVPIPVQWDLWVTYLIWVGVVLVLWGPCRWFGDLKRRRKDWTWLSYL